LFFNIFQGGDAVWGTSTHAPDDNCEKHHTHGELIAFRESPPLDGTIVRNMTAEESSQWILEHTPSTFQVLMFVLTIPWSVLKICIRPENA